MLRRGVAAVSQQPSPDAARLLGGYKSFLVELRLSRRTIKARGCRGDYAKTRVSADREWGAYVISLGNAERELRLEWER